MKWQPMSTAPRNEDISIHKVLLRFGGDGISIAYWDPYYAEGGRGYVDGFAWIEPFSGEPLNLHFSTEPDAWMELPFKEEAAILPSIAVDIVDRIREDAAIMSGATGFPTVAAELSEAADAIEALQRQIMKLEFELTARDINDMATMEAVEKMQESIKLLERRITKKRSAGF